MRQKRRKRGNFRQQWPAPLPAQEQLKLTREMAHHRARMTYYHVWRLACCRTQNLLLWNTANRHLETAKRDYERARNRLWETNMALVEWNAGKFQNSVLTVDELVAIGAARLPYMLDRFDPYRGYYLSTYLATALYRLFVGELQKAAKVRDVTVHIGFLDGHALAEEEVLCQVSVDDYDEPHFEELLPAVKEAIAELPERERKVIELRTSGKALQWIAMQHKRSKERVRQWEQRALALVAERIGVEAPQLSLGQV
jgi:RNA polymerase sigma factor (sigma-70 family)